MTKGPRVSDSGHLNDDQLVAALDGELPEADLARVGDHLAACWTCRARRDALANAMTDFVQARDLVIFSRIAPPASWPGLQPRLARLEAEPTTSSDTGWARLFSVVRVRHLTLARWRPLIAGAALFAIAILVVQSLYERPLAAAEVLARARPVETLDGHRQLTIEEREAASGRILGRHRVDVWHTRAGRVVARRLFDERGLIVAGEWTRADGTRTVVVRGQPPRTESPGSQVPVTASNAWRLSPSAATFSELTSTGTRLPAMELSESDDAYKVSAPLANAEFANAERAMIVLTLRKVDMHPVAHTLTLGPTTVSVVETTFDVSSASTPASVFELDRELLDPRSVEVAASRRRIATRGTSLTDEEAIALEVDALVQLDRVGALSREQVSIVRSSDRVAIDVRAETAARRDELQTTLAPLATRPGARVAVRTFAEAEPERRDAKPPSVKVIEFDAAHAPAYDDVRAFFLSQTPAHVADAVELERRIHRLTRTVLERSLNARLHARAIVQLTSRISSSDLHALDERRSRDWWSAVVQHARAFEDETRAVRVELEPVFHASTARDVAMNSASPAADVWKDATRLLALATAHDADLAQAFSRSERDPDGRLAVRSPRFRESLLAAEALAASIRAAALPAR